MMGLGSFGPRPGWKARLAELVAGRDWGDGPERFTLSVGPESLEYSSAIVAEFLRRQNAEPVAGIGRGRILVEAFSFGFSSAGPFGEMRVAVLGPGREWDGPAGLYRGYADLNRIPGG